MKLFKKKPRVFKSEFEKILEDERVKKLAMSELKIKSNDSGEWVWVNPNIQDVYNCGWYTKEDFKDFLNGTGRIIKGKTQEEKDKFLAYDIFRDTYYQSWRIALNFEHFDKIEIYKFNRNGWHSYVDNPVKFKKTNTEECIKRIFGSFVQGIINDLDCWGNVCDKELFDRVYKEYQDNSYGIGATLMLQGFGYWGACNTPCNVENFAWYRDVVFDYAYYQHLLNQGVEMPDFKFVLKNRYEM
jgi:hypothetical protein